jgi:hypothetical protein
MRSVDDRNVVMRRKTVNDNMEMRVVAARVGVRPDKVRGVNARNVSWLVITPPSPYHCAHRSVITSFGPPPERKE